ncbi:MAG: HsdR family type I site-specific deoxyribonuclease [Actinomycetota bacterium]|nr:HsdR family type I site-specific deoxyribonuclease [Actinomycetota bacterium]
MTTGSEGGSVQYPFIRYAHEIGWTVLSRDEALQFRGGETGVVFTDVLVDQLQALNPGTVNHDRAVDLAHRVVRALPNIKGNADVWEYLRGLRKVFVEEESRERDVRFLDLDDPSNNVFHVTDEFSFRPRPDAEAIRFDIALLINGIPVILVETKSATKRDGMAEALVQVRRYHEQGPEALAVLQLFAITQLHRFLYGATWNANRKSLYNWRDEVTGNYEDLVKAFVAPERVLRVVSDFIVFSSIDGELNKFVLRPHQMRAADRVVERAKDPAKRRALVWHTQGSGKTYTMITAAKLLIEDKALEHPTVLVLVDRTELETQLAGNLEALGYGDVRIAQSKKDLEGLLRSDWRGLIVSMIHKFDGMPPDLCPRENVFVLIDEAHRTTGGALGTYLMAALPNATYVGFTGTPIDKTEHGKGTFKTFGPDDESGFLDKYSIRESIEDGTTVPLNYALAPNELLVDRATLEAEFLQVAELEGVSDIETLNKVLERAVTLRNLMKNRERVDGVAKFIAEHYRSNVEPMGYKAFVVGVDREACALYKDALDRYLPPEYSDVVISHGHNDPAELRRFHYDETKELEIRKVFRKPDGLPKILIVTEKLLTGFDAPILYAMYLDKPMRDHVLLQCIARVNRPYEDADDRAKPAGFVLDFVGIFEKLEQALAFDSKDVSGVVTGIPDLQKRFAELMAQARAEYLGIGKGLHADKEVEAIVEYFRDEERRTTLQEFVSEMENLFEIISPDAFLRPYLDDYDAVMRISAIVREAFYPGIDVDRSFLRKTAELVQEHTATSPIQGISKVYKLSEESLHQLTLMDAPDTVKVVNLVKLLHDLVANERDTKPFLLSIGEKAEEIAAAFRDRQMSTEEALAALARLATEAIQAEKEQEATGLKPEAFAALWYLKGKGVEEAKAQIVAGAAAAVFDECPQWRLRTDQERQVRIKLHAALIKAGEKDGSSDYVEDIIESLRRVQP